MKKLLAMVLSLIMLITCTTLPTAAFAAANDRQTAQSDSKLNYKEGEAIAVMKPSTSQKYFANRNISALFGPSVKLDTSGLMAGSNSAIYSSNHMKVAAFKSATLSTEQLIKKLEKDDNVLYAIPNYIFKASDITDDTYSKYQWALQNDGFNGGAADKDVNPEELWEKAKASKDEKIVVVCDTGIDYNHEDLKDSLWVNPYGAKLVGKYGYDFSGENKDHSPLDDNGHGTHVAGIIAGQSDNQKGISGINKNNVKIMSLKWLNAEGEGDTESILACYDYIKRALKLGANIVAVNNSWGGVADPDTQALFDSVFDEFGKLGVVSTISAGNDAADIEISDDFGPIFDDGELVNIPASTDSDYALVVGATNEQDNLASFSSYSKKYVDVSAPGTNILSSVSYNCFNPSIYDAQQLSDLCKDYQSFDGEFTSSSFGYPEIVDKYTAEGLEYVTNASASLAEEGFGYTGKALKITTNDKADKEGLPLYYVSIPYTLDDADKNYSLSFQIRSVKDARVCVYDAPADITPVQAANDMDGMIYLSEFSGNDYWDHVYVDYDVKEDSEHGIYNKSAQRQLVFEISAPDINTEVFIDDLAVSSQSANADDFGKYDFYNGTSMAAPYVTGAVALVSNAYPDASTLDVINIVKNTGRVNTALDKYTENSRVLSLDKSQNTPPIISSVAYDNSGKVAISGSFSQISSVKVNGTVVTPASTGKSKIVIPDNNYSTKKIMIEVENAFGSSSKSVVISKKRLYPEIISEDGAPVGSNLIVPAGDMAYAISSEGIFSMSAEPSMEDDTKLEALYDIAPAVDYTQLFDAVSVPNITTAVFMNNKLYFIAENYVYAANSAVIGCDKVFAYLDLETEKTVKLCEIPHDVLIGQTLAVYNGNVYMLGGYDEDEKTFSKDFYKYNTSKKAFEKTEYNLTQGRAYAKALQYKNKLYLVYGADATKQMPKIMIFDGSKWTESKVSLDSDDCEKYDEINIYNGNIGYSVNGLYCVGSYVYSIGDSFNYNVQSDSISASEYCGKKSVNDSELIGTTIYGMFMGYSAAYDKSVDDYVSKTYAVEMETDFATIEPDFEVMMDAPVQLDCGESYAHPYGDKVTVTATADYGYVVTGIKAGSKTYAVDAKGRADIVLNTPSTLVSVSYKKVAPNKVTGLKVSATSSTTYTLSWSKPSRAAGYHVQQYKNKKWTTIATINNPNTTKYKVSKTAVGTNQYRVRAFSNYNSKKYNGAFSSTLKVYVSSKQKIKSVKALSKGFTVAYTKNKSVSGYEIQYATNKKFSKAKTVNVKGSSTVTKKITKLSAKKTYYVRVRSYKTVNGKKVYGQWSAAKQIKTKK